MKCVACILCCITHFRVLNCLRKQLQHRSSALGNCPVAAHKPKIIMHNDGHQVEPCNANCHWTWETFSLEWWIIVKSHFGRWQENTTYRNALCKFLVQEGYRARSIQFMVCWIWRGITPVACQSHSTALVLYELWARTSHPLTVLDLTNSLLSFCPQ